MPFIEANGKRILFIHIPKTAGTSVEAWLESFAPLHFHAIGKPAALKTTPQHLRRSDFAALFADGYFDYCFALTRNPYHRLESEYRMQMTVREGGLWRKKPAFSQWLERNLQAASRDPWHADNHFRPQWDFIGSDVELFRLEDGLDQALHTVAAKTGLHPPDTEPRHLQTSPEFPEPIHWDEVDRLRVQDFYARDFQRFGY